ncbi:Tax1-binding protein [Dirofilaria immitis]
MNLGITLITSQDGGFIISGGIDQEPIRAYYPYSDSAEPDTPTERAGLRQHDKYLEIRQALDCSPPNRERELGLDVVRQTFGSCARPIGQWCEATIWRIMLNASKSESHLDKATINLLPDMGRHYYVIPRLILSAVICLSQRLSHACLNSDKPIMVKPRTAHYNSYNVLMVIIQRG